MGRGIEGQHLIALTDERCNVAVKVFGGRFKAMNDQRFMGVWMVPAMAPDDNAFQGKGELLPLPKNRRRFLFDLRRGVQNNSNALRAARLVETSDSMLNLARI